MFDIIDARCSHEVCAMHCSCAAVAYYYLTKIISEVKIFNFGHPSFRQSTFT